MPHSHKVWVYFASPWYHASISCLVDSGLGPIGTQLAVQESITADVRIWNPSFCFGKSSCHRRTGPISWRVEEMLSDGLWNIINRNALVRTFAMSLFIEQLLTNSLSIFSEIGTDNRAYLSASSPSWSNEFDQLRYPKVVGVHEVVWITFTNLSWCGIIISTFRSPISWPEPRPHLPGKQYMKRGGEEV